MIASLISQLKPHRVEVLMIVVAESEARVLAQLEIAAAADQRSLTFSGFTIAATTAASTGFLYLIETQSQKAWLFVGVLILAFGLLISTGCALYSVWARGYFPPGSKPSNWVSAN
nr:hypothetical protein [Polymorphobacter sp.]